MKHTVVVLSKAFRGDIQKTLFYQHYLWNHFVIFDMFPHYLYEPWQKIISFITNFEWRIVAPKWIWIKVPRLTISLYSVVILDLYMLRNIWNGKSWVLWSSCENNDPEEAYGKVWVWQKYRSILSVQLKLRHKDKPQPFCWKTVGIGKYCLKLLYILLLHTNGLTEKWSLTKFCCTFLIWCLHFFFI